MKMTGGTSSTVDWCSLPTEIMEIIADRLLSLADRCRIRAVCKCWRSVTPTARRPNTPPFLYVVPHNRILCLVEKRKYYLPHMRTKYDCQPFGSAHGLLGLVDLERVFLFDPLSGYRFDLPPLWTLPDVKTVAFDRTTGSRTAFCLEPDGYDLTAEELRDTLLIKLSASPTMETVIAYGDGQLASAKPGRKKWTTIKAPVDYPFEFMRFNDVVYHHPDGKFYAIDHYGYTVSMDAAHGNVRTVVPTDVDYDRGHASEGPYLLSLPTGELLFMMILIEDPREMRGLRFVLRKLVGGEGRDGPAWERVERLDGWTVFVDPTGSWARPAADAVGYEGNCIYFSISHEYKWKGKMCRSVYNGICDMVENSIQPMCCSSLNKRHQPAAGLWLETRYK